MKYTENEANEIWNSISLKQKEFLLNYIDPFLTIYLTEQEREICVNLGKGYIARGKRGELTWFEEIPHRDSYDCWEGFWSSESASIDETLFKFITWDNEPCSVETMILFLQKK